MWTLTLPYRAVDCEVASFKSPQIKRRSTSCLLCPAIPLNQTKPTANGKRAIVQPSGNDTAKIQTFSDMAKKTMHPQTDA